MLRCSIDITVGVPPLPGWGQDRHLEVLNIGADGLEATPDQAELQRVRMEAVGSGLNLMMHVECMTSGVIVAEERLRR